MIQRHRWWFGPLVLVGLYLLLAPVAGAVEKRPMTVDDMLDMVRIDDVMMIPDGTRVFYTESHLNWEKNEYEKTLYSVPFEGGEAVPIVREGGENFRISPDGKSLAFIREIEDRPQIFLLSLELGEPWSLTEWRSQIVDYRWSGDSKTIVFLAEEVFSEERENELELGNDAIYVNEGPHGKNYGRWTHLWKVEIATKDVTSILEKDLLIDGFDVSPDGSRVVVAARPDNRGNFPFFSELFVVGTDGGEPIQVTDNRAIEMDPLWAPDGQRIVFHASSSETFDLRNGYLWILNPDEGDLTRLEAHRTGEIDHLVWSVDGKSLFFNEVQGTNTNLFRLDIESDELHTVSTEIGTRRVEAYSRDRARVAYTFHDFTTPPDLYSSTLEGAEAVQLTRANPWIEEEILLPTSQVIRWQSQDGMEIEGIFMVPSDRLQQEQVPFILQIHGGPSGYWANAFEPDLIVYTGLGYAILGPNVRGSSGYGDELLRGLMMDVGGGEYEDLMTGVDQVIEAGVVDAERMGVAGWSWGGVLAGWVITQTDRFQAASVGAGVSNWIAESGPGYNWDIANWYVGGKHWTHRDEWRRRSAINFVENVTTPTLFLHGEMDQTSSTNQSMFFFDALQELGVPTRFIKFPRQKHGIEEPRLRRVRFVEEFRWMQKWVRDLEWSPWLRPESGS